MNQQGLEFTPATIISCLGIERDKYKEALNDLLITRRPMVASAANWRYYAELMIEQSRVVYLQSRLMEFQARLEHESSDAVLPDITNLMTKIAVRQMRDSPIPIDECLDRVVRDLESREIGQQVPARWGLRTLDDLFPRGIEPGDLVVVGGRPGQGKTAFALQLTAHNVAAGKKVLFMSLEMTAISLVKRLWAHVSQVPINALYGPNYEWRSATAQRSADDLRTWRDRLWVLPAENQFERLASTISLYRRQHGIDGVVVDYLGLIRSSRIAEKRYLEVAHYSHELNYMCKSLGLWCVMVSQLNRDQEGSGRFNRPGMQRLRESGDVEQDADVILMAYQDRERTEQDQGRRPITIWIEKHRHEDPQRGALAWFVGSTQHIVDAPERSCESGLDAPESLSYSDKDNSRFAVDHSPF